MDPRWRHPYGLRPTLRHVMILVVFAAVVSALFRGAPGEVVTLVLPLTPPLLAVLVFVFERPSPAKYWLCGLLASMFVPAVAAWFDLTAWRYGEKTMVALALVPVNGLALVWVGRFVRRLPAACPGCGLRSLLPLGRRARGMRWCASCGFTERAEQAAAAAPR
jgi:hypothetical protein